MTEDVDSLLSALRLQGPGPGFAARTALAFERARQTKRIKTMVSQLMLAAGLSIALATVAYFAGWISPALLAMKVGLALADATMALRLFKRVVSAAPLVWGVLVAVMAMASIATTVALERSLRWAIK